MTKRGSSSPAGLIRPPVQTNLGILPAKTGGSRGHTAQPAPTGNFQRRLLQVEADPVPHSSRGQKDMASGPDKQVSEVKSLCRQAQDLAQSDVCVLLCRPLATQINFASFKPQAALWSPTPRTKMQDGQRGVTAESEVVPGSWGRIRFFHPTLARCASTA